MNFTFCNKAFTNYSQVEILFINIKIKKKKKSSIENTEERIPYPDCKVLWKQPTVAIFFACYTRFV